MYRPPHLTDVRLTWVISPAERLADHLHADTVDAVVCNSAIWKTDTAAVFAAVARILRPGGHFVFNIGGGFVGVQHPDELSTRTGPFLNALIRRAAAEAHGYIPPPRDADRPPKLPPETVTEQLNAAVLTVVGTEVTAQHSTMAEKKAWLSTPVFARPEGHFTHAQRMQILDAAHAVTTPGAPAVTSCLVVAQRPEAVA